MLHFNTDMKIDMKSYHDALSNLCLDDRSQDAEMLIHLPADVGCAEATVDVTPENHLDERCFPTVLLYSVLPPVAVT